MQQLHSSNLLIDRFVRVEYPQASLHLCCFIIESKNPMPKVLQHLSKPDLQQCCLHLIAPMSNQMKTTSQLTDGDR